MTSASASGGRFWRSVSRVREFFLLTQHLAEARSLSASARSSARREAVHAKNLVAFASVCPDAERSLAVSFYREACRALVKAYLVVRRHETFDAAWHELEQRLSRESGASGLPVRFRERLSAGRVCEEASDSSETLAEWAQLYSLIDGLLELHSPLELAVLRVVRFAVAAVMLIGFALPLARSRGPNLALNAHVTASSVAFHTKPEGAVDGIIYNQLGFHSSDDGDPRLTIDLARVVRVKEIVLFGRGDCCFEQSIPLSLEVSSDGVSYRRVARLSERFSQVDPWRVQFEAVETRFVRIHSLRRSVLVLSEVQVFGR